MSGVSRWDVWSIAPKVSRGAPADVLSALSLIGHALVRGDTVDERELRWPEPLLRRAVVDSIESTELRKAACMRPATVAVALDDIVMVLEHAWSSERKMRAGRALAREFGHSRWSEGELSDEAIRTLWEPLADRGVRAELRARWASMQTLHHRERSSGALPKVDWEAPAQGFVTVRDAVDAIVPSIETSADGAAFALRLSVETRVIEAAPAARQRPAIDPDARMSPEQAAQWIAWRRASVARRHRATNRRSTLDPRRHGPVYVALASASESDELTAFSLLILTIATAQNLGRSAYVIDSREGSSAQVEVQHNAALRDVFELVREQHKPLRALSWLLESASPEELQGAEFVLVSASDAGNVGGEPLLGDLEQRVEKARTDGLRLHLLRTKSMIAYPHVRLFDMLHFPEFTPRFYEELRTRSSLRPR